MIKSYLSCPEDLVFPIFSHVLALEKEKILKVLCLRILLENHTKKKQVSLKEYYT